MTALDWIIVLLLNGGVIVFGLFVARGTATGEDWFVGRRSLIWWSIGLSMFATNVDNADLVSLTGTTYQEGLHIIAVHTLGAVLGVVLAAFCIVPVMYRAGHYTNAEYLEARFGPATRVLSAVIQLQYRSSMLGLMIWSLFLLLTGFLKMTAAMAWTLIVAMVVLAAIYTAWGGLKSVVLTDAGQAVIMFAGMAVIFFAVWNAAGGWSGMMSVLEAARLGDGRPASDLARMGRYAGDAGQTSPHVILLGWMIIAGGYWTVNHTQTMRLLGSRSVWDMKMAALFGAAISMPVMVGCATLGLFARALFPEFERPDQLYPHMANLYLGAGLKGLVIAGVLAAAISTFDSMGSALSAVFTRDIYARLIVRNREDAHYVFVSRIATVGILALGFVYLPFISSKDTMLKAFLTLIPVLVTPLFTIYVIGIFTPAHPRAGMGGIIAGGAYGLLALYDREVADVAWLAPWFTNRWVALSWAVIFTVLGALLVTLRCGRMMPVANGLPAARGWTEGGRGETPAAREHPFVTEIPAWARPELYAALLTVVTAVVLFRYFW